MKIIDLLNKIAKGEIKQGAKFEMFCNNYIYNNGYIAKTDGNKTIENFYISQRMLNDEIETIEEVEDKEYEDIEGINYYPKNKTEFQVDYYEDGELKHFCLNKKQRYFADTINALIRNQKYILERLDKNERSK